MTRGQSSLHRPDALYLGFAFLYVALLPAWPYFGSSALKVLPFVILGLSVWPKPLAPAKSAVLVGLALGALGDVLLDVRTSGMFLLGLGAFLLGHLSYAHAFFRVARGGPPVRWRRVVAVLGYGAAMGAFLLPQVGPALRVPVALYVAAIVLMACTAVAASRKSALLAAGAACFLLSDTLLATRKFIMPALPFGSYAVMITYYAAQYGLVRGYEREVSRT